MKKIAELGDREWDTQVNRYKRENNYIELTEPTEIAVNYEKYKNKVMHLPRVVIDQSQVFEFSGDAATYYRITYHGYFYIGILDDQTIWDNRIIFNNLFGWEDKVEFEMLGKIKSMDIDSKGNMNVTLDLVAVRQAGRFCMLIEQEKAVFIGWEFIQKERDRRRAEWAKDIPKNLESLPQGLDSLTVAKLFCYLANVEKNRPVWDALLSKDLSAEWADNQWRILIREKFVLFYMGVDTKKTTDKTKVYFYQVIYNGVYNILLQRIRLERENGEWKVVYAF